MPEAKSAGPPFDANLRQEARALFGLAVSILRDVQEAEDAVQDTLELAWRARDSVRDPERRHAWLKQICLRRCLRIRRGLLRRLFLNDLPPAETQPLDPADPALDRACRDLTRQQRAVIALHYQYGYSLDACAALMGCRPGTARSHRAMRCQLFAGNWEKAIVPDLEQRLRAHLGRVVATPPAEGIEERMARQAAQHAGPPRRAWLGSVSASAALLVVVIGLFFGLRAIRDHAAVKPTPSATPVPSPTGSTVPTGAPTILALRMISAGVGWALTDQGLLRTTDDWSHSANVGPAGILLQGANAAFLNATTAWVAAGQGSPPDTISIFRTTDGGRSWQRSSLVDSQAAGPALIDFVDPMHGWLMLSYGAAAGSEGVGLYRSTDGGGHWTLVDQTLGGIQTTPGTISFGCDKNGVAFINATTGWATGECYGGPPLFSVTHDGGRTWSRQSLPDMSKLIFYNGSNTMLPVFFADGSGYFTLTANATEVLYTTRDAGTTWTQHALPTAGGSGQPPIVAFSSLSDGWVISQDGSVIYRTNDGGQRWTSFRPAPTLTQMQSFDVEDAAYAVAVINPSGNQNILLETSDGGRTWITKRIGS